MMSSRIVCVLGLLLASISHTYAQRTQDQVVLENGSQIRGEVLVDDDFSTIRIRTIDGSIWVFDTANVLAINVVPHFKAKRVIVPKDTGFYNLTQTDLALGNAANYLRANGGIKMVNGWQFNPRWSAGLGVGLEGYDINVMPLFADVRFYLRPSKAFSPFFNSELGYAVPLDNYKLQGGRKANIGGIMASGSFGVRRYINDRFGVVLSAGYRFQHLVSRYQTWWWTEHPAEGKRISTYNRMTLKLGFLFH